ncbi:hypothetical protein BOX15_Mlig022972g1 [Macrostomum lignano]|uniref:Uncharacterized protein n=1 Tax=Macrostomum lignano TaxID=282301 RepID=A0A267GVW2_9PLAT|nr:hypothetical protein BOX15_Mlig022972g1 [Macrostomum lignano]
MRSKPLAWLHFCLPPLLILLLAQRTGAQDLPLISEANSGADLTAALGASVNLTCVALRNASVAWYFTDQHLFVSSYSGDSAPQQLLSSGHAYSVQSLTPAAVGNLTNEYLALTLTVQVSEQTFGHYQCQASLGSASKQVHDIYLRINGSLGPELNRSAFYNCCIAKDLAAQCRVFCEPWKLTADSSTLSTLFNCLSDLNNKVASCGLGSSNVGRCCARQEVPTPCLPMCQAASSASSALSTALLTNPVCFNGTVMEDIFVCHAEGLVSVPGPPLDVSASLDKEKRQISVKWAEPTRNPQLVRGYSVHWKADSDAYFSSNVSMSILVGASINLPAAPLAPQYSVYVQSLGAHGTSPPSPTVTTVLPPAVPNASVTPVTKCCLNKLMSASCAERLCSGRPILDLNTIINSTCGKHVSEAFACYAGGRNHTGCCQAQAVPLAACGKFCTGETPHVEVADTVACLPHLDSIARCYDTGAAGIPSPPRQLVLDGITDRSVSVHWQPPLYNPDKVLNYSLMVLDKVTGWRTAVSTPLTQQTVSGLASDRFYELAVVAVGSDGSSLPSNRMTVMTMDSPPGSSRPTGTSGQPDMPVCCGLLGVPTNCSGQCASPSAFNAAALSPACRNGSALLNLLACLVDGRNNTACCRAKGVPDSCLPVCVARPGDPPPPAHCFDILDSAAACARDAYDKVPSEPIRLRVESYGTNFVDLAWQLPVRRPVDFRYQLVADVRAGGSVQTGVVLSQFPADVTVGHVVSLQPGGHYSFRLAAVSDSGSSVLSDAVTVWLLPDLPSNWSASVNTSRLPYGISQCCQARKVPSHCQLLCDPRNMTNFNHTDSSLSVVYNNCTDSLPDITFCLADGKNHEPCCRRENVPDVCLGLCSGASVPSGSLTCPLWWREIYGCIEEGIISVPPAPVIHRVDVFSNRLTVTYDRGTLDNDTRSILYIRFADTPSHWYAFLNPSNPAVFRVPSNTSFSLFMLNSNTNGSSQPSPVRTVRTLPDDPLSMYINTNAKTFRVLESSRPLILNCYYWWPLVATPTYRWFRSGHLLQSGSSSSYTIPHAEARDSGLYTCALQLSTGQSGSVSASLHIQSAVTAASLTGLVPVRLGSAARLSCAFEGFPDRVEWRDSSGVPVVQTRDGSVRVPVFSISDLLTYSSVEFSAVSASQLGHYTCTGFNPLGSHSARSLLYDASDATPAPPTAGPAPTSSGGATTGNGSASAVCCANRGVGAACIGVCSASVAHPVSANCTDAFADHASHCLADSRNFSRCCQRSHAVPPACLPLCWGDPPAPADVASCTAAVDSTVAGCLRQTGVPGPPLTVTAQPKAPHGLLVTWQPPARNPESVSGYRILMRVAGSPGKLIQASVGRSKLSHLQTPVPTSAAISVTVVAIGGDNGDSLASLPASAATPGPPGVPQNVHLVSAGNNIAKIAWVVIPGTTRQTPSR